MLPSLAFTNLKYVPKRQHADTQQEEKNTDKAFNIRRWTPQNIAPSAHMHRLWQESKAMAWVQQVRKTCKTFTKWFGDIHQAGSHSGPRHRDDRQSQWAWEPGITAMNHVDETSWSKLQSKLQYARSSKGRQQYWWKESCIWGCFQPCLYIYTCQWCTCVFPPVICNHHEVSGVHASSLQLFVTTMKSVVYIHLPSTEDHGESLVHPRLTEWQCFGNGSDLTNRRNIWTSTNLTHNTKTEEVSNNHNNNTFI